MSLVRLSAPLPSSPTDGVHRRYSIPSGNAGTAQTIKHMRKLVSQGKRDTRVRRALKNILGPCSDKDYYCYAEQIFEFCQNRIKYVWDPNGVEFVESPYQILQSGVADCDSICILCATLWEQAGFPASFVTIKADTNRPDLFSHVYPEVKIPGRGWVGGDPTMKGKPFGWTPPKKYPAKRWPASFDQSEVREGDKMAGFRPMGDIIPEVQEASGIAAGNAPNWRLEPETLVITSPEQLELTHVLPEETRPSPEGASYNEYFFADRAEQKFPEEYRQADSGDVDLEVVQKSRVNLGVLVLVGLGAFLLMGRRR